MSIMSTLVVSLDDSTVHPVYSQLDPDEVVEKLEEGKFVFGEAPFGDIWVAPASVRYVAKGRARLPVSSSPGQTSASEHRAMISPAMG